MTEIMPPMVPVRLWPIGYNVLNPNIRSGGGAAGAEARFSQCQQGPHGTWSAFNPSRNVLVQHMAIEPRRREGHTQQRSAEFIPLPRHGQTGHRRFVRVAKRMNSALPAIGTRFEGWEPPQRLVFFAV
jgi:hypothetical protein